MQPWLAFTAPHGATDLFSHAPSAVAIAHASSLFGVAALPEEYRPIALIPFSILHMRKDYGGVVPCTLMHACWLAFPGLAQACIGLYHTPMHYFRFMRLSKNADELNTRVCFVVGLFMVSCIFASGYVPEASLQSFHGMWVAPVVGHCYLSESLEEA